MGICLSLLAESGSSQLAVLLQLLLLPPAGCAPFSVPQQAQMLYSESMGFMSDLETSGNQERAILKLQEAVDLKPDMAQVHWSGKGSVVRPAEGLHTALAVMLKQEGYGAPPVPVSYKNGMLNEEAENKLQAYMKKVEEAKRKSPHDHTNPYRKNHEAHHHEHALPHEAHHHEHAAKPGASWPPPHAQDMPPASAPPMPQPQGSHQAKGMPSAITLGLGIAFAAVGICLLAMRRMGSSAAQCKSKHYD